MRLSRHGIEHGAAQLTTVLRIACVAGGAGVDDEKVADMRDHLLVSMSEEHEIGVRLSKSL